MTTKGRISVADVQQLAEMLATTRSSANEAPDVSAMPADPERYPRKIQVDDPEALHLIEQLDQYVHAMRQLARKAERLNAQITITQSDLSDRLEEVYPSVYLMRRGGAGLRDWRGAWWYVGWTAKMFAGENPDAPQAGDGLGQYL